MDDYEEHVLKTAEGIEAETQQVNKDFLDAMVGFNKVELDASRDKEEKQVIDLVDGIKENEAPIEQDIEDLFIDDNDLFENDDIIQDHKKFIRELIDRADFASSTKIYDNDDDDVDIDFVKEVINIEDKSEDEAKEDSIMDLIEIKNEFEREQNSLKEQEGQSYPIRVEKASRKLKDPSNHPRKKLTQKTHDELDYIKTVSSPSDN